MSCVSTNIIANMQKILSLVFHTISSQKQFVRYILAGFGNTAFSYGLYVIFLLVGFDYQIANLMALVLGIAFSFTTQGTVVFRNSTSITFLKFIIAWICLYILNISIITLLMRMPMTAYLAGAIATIPVTLISYFVLKFLVFVKR